MERRKQSADEILETLRSLEVDWMDDTARSVIEELQDLPIKHGYTSEDLRPIFDRDFNIGMLLSRTILGLSKDKFIPMMNNAVGGRTCGVTLYRREPELVLEALDSLSVPGLLAEAVNREPHWSDVMVERLRSGRGSAISGMKRGRDVEDFVEDIVRKVFGRNYRSRCSFTGQDSREAKCDFAIPGTIEPRIVIEAKGYGATGSKMTDVLGDLLKIIEVKRSDTMLLFVTEGTTWRRRRSDLEKIVAHQHRGDIMRVYTYAMADQLEADLRRLRAEQGL